MKLCFALVLAHFACFSFGAPAAILSAVPVVYVLFGHIPEYLMINIELASRNNPVVVLIDINPSTLTSEGVSVDTIISQWSGAESKDFKGVQFVRMGEELMKSAREFAKVYVHLCKDTSAGRQKHELQNYQRWFVFKEYVH